MLNDSSQIGATGFFIKNNDEYFFITAYHCLTFKDPDSGILLYSKLKPINSLIIYRNIEEFNNGIYLKYMFGPDGIPPVELTTYKKDGKLLDICKFRYDRFEFNFNHITIETDSYAKPIINENVYFYGFPINDGIQSDEPELYTGKITQIDTSDNSFIILGKAFVGCSGAPVFLSSNNKIIGVLNSIIKNTLGFSCLLKATNIDFVLNE